MSNSADSAVNIFFLNCSMIKLNKKEPGQNEVDIFPYLPSCRIWHKVILIWEAMHRLRPMCRQVQKMLVLVGIPLLVGPQALSDKLNPASGYCLG